MIRFLRSLFWRWQLRRIEKLEPYPPLPPPIYLRLVGGAELPDISRRRRRVVIVSEMESDSTWMNAVAHWLVQSGCLYAVTWGTDCEEWHDSIDWANLERFGFGDIPDENFIMTSWHHNESLEEALWFARECAHPYREAVTLQETMILHIAEQDREAQIVKLYETVDLADDESLTVS